MRTFVAALAFATVYAQDAEEEKTTTEVVEDSWSSVKNWFASSTQEYLTTEQKQTPMGSYEKEGEASMKSSISLDYTLIGTNFVTVSMDLTNADSAMFAENTRNLVYFQIEEPVAKDEEAARLLQEEDAAADAEPAAEEPEVSGTGNFEGWFCYAKWGAGGKIATMTGFNLWGTEKFADIATFKPTYPGTQGWLDKYGAKETEAKDPWQASEPAEKFNYFEVGKEGAPHLWRNTAWRIASADDVTTLRFKLLNQHHYWGTVGHYHWAADATKDSNAAQRNNSGHVKFMLDGASAMTLGLSAAVAALAFF